jgi:FMN phosphatase YigB (HAD superfamily)
MMSPGLWPHPTARSGAGANCGRDTVDSVVVPRRPFSGETMIKAVTFDLWDTLVVDDSDEPTRYALGLGTKGDARRNLFVGEMVQGAGVSEFMGEEGFNHATMWFNQQWHRHHRTPSLRERFIHGFAHVGFEPTPGFDKMVERFGRMEVEVPPVLCDNVIATLEALRKDYPLGIISDAIVTPGAQLREIMGNHGILKYFSDFVFSDEAGRSKPDQLVFELAADGLGVEIEELVHIGDREINDIQGPHRVGAKSILYTGAKKATGAKITTEADAICTDLADLPAIIARLSAGDR